jgi:hypothetical protein
LFYLLVAQAAFAKPPPGNPHPDVNIVGPTTDPMDIRDEGLKQQNEPACAMRPGDGDCIICFYNDYRTVDIFEHQDAWIGMSESCDAGDTWRSRITPGHPTHPAPIGTEFAADPRAIGIPGMTIHGFIGGFRDQDIGAIAVQHWLENNQEDGDYNEPTLNTTIVDEGTEGRFIDKPEFYFKMAEGDPQPTMTLSFDMENQELGTNGTITRTFPAGTLYAAYAVFTGSQSVKLLVKRSNDLGQTWTNQVKKLTESQNLVTGITMTSLGNTTMAMWRQVQDNNDLDAIYYATTTNDGNSWSKPILLTEICRFDQPSTTQTSPVALATFRTNDFPWLANDGKNIYAFFTERVGGCDTGTPKIFMQYTSNGNSWSSSEQVVDSTFEPDSVPGAQFMPAAFGARGKVQVAWYDTRRENFPFEPELPFVADYIPESGMLINRKVDVYTARITSNESGGNVQISESVRVNQPRTIRDADAPAGPPFEIEASFANAKMYASGFLAFVGDYFAVTAQEFREDGFGGWEENYSPVTGVSNLANFFIAYADNRDVRGDVLFDGGGGQNQYTPPDNVPGPGGAAYYVSPEDADKKVLLADSAAEPQTTENERRSTEGIEDIFVDPATACVQDKDRTRDANIYGSLIRDELRLSSPVESRPLSGILRAIPFIARNTTSEPPPPPPTVAPPTPYRLYIATQPGPEFLVNRASFRQKPFVGPFPSVPPLSDLVEDIEIERNGAVARTIFMVSPDIGATVEVQIYDGACALATDDENGPTLDFTACELFGSITLGGSGTAGPLQQPDYLAIQCEDNPDDCDVSVTELHNPIIENPIIENPIIENPIIENVELSAMELENPIIENPIIENLGFENPIIENPIIENPIIENPIIENPIIENPIIENPIIENTAYADGLTYVDFTNVVRNDGNVATAYNVDQTVANFETTGGLEPVSQLIVWKQYVTGTSRNCEYRAEARNQVITTVNQPDNNLEKTTIENPFAGEASFILAPGEQGFITYRVFGTVGELTPVRLSGLTVASQAANCDETDDTVGPGAGEDQFNFYECQNQIEDFRERILFEADSEPPVFVPPPNSGDTIPDGDPFDANVPGGACVDQAFLASFFTVTDNESTTITLSCENAQGDQICIDPGDPGLSAPIGISPITCTATDETGNSASINLEFAVEDPDPPFFTSVITADRMAIADAIDGTASVNLEAGFAGEDQFGVDPNPVIACKTETDLTSNDDIPIGTYSVTCAITDASGNSAEAPPYSLQVLDETAPTFTSTQADIPADAGANGTAIVSFSTPTAEDNSGQAPNVSCDPVSGTAFDVGTTPVTCTATDAAGNFAELTFNVTVQDNTAPLLVLNGVNPLALEVGETYTEDGAIAMDNVDGAVAVNVTGTVDTATPGTYTLTYSASDAAGNSASVTRTVVVSDNTGPTISDVPGTTTAEATSGAGAEVTYTEPTATDLSSGGASISCAPASGSVFPLGTTTVVCTATDSSGNTAQATFDIVVQDTVSPVLTVSPDPFVAYTTGSTEVPVDFSGAISVTDTVDPNPTYVCAPSSGSQFGAGDTTVSCTASDASGNTSDTAFTVTVGYAGGIGVFANKYNARGGSSNPLTWAWQDEFGNNIDTSGDVQILRIVDCDDPTIVVLDMAGDPGQSGFKFKVDDSWEFNWQSDYPADYPDPLLAGGPLEPGDYCPSVESDLTGDTLLITPRPVTVR